MKNHLFLITFLILNFAIISSVRGVSLDRAFLAYIAQVEANSCEELGNYPKAVEKFQELTKMFPEYKDYYEVKINELEKQESPGFVGKIFKKINNPFAECK